ncbi:carbohydrate kinase [Streptomyces sp. ISL-96]|uniref:FGGY-family carbohydrate kinase n=1 Tax=Streptomyces sp. ISL-96 TaxID=2819191 RepID=UPI001BEA98E7|nr:FGGY family carbohydrate kinase [Streptomyces sp. ISL-96]MBT2489039.1 carbohydrate kinase [Streptomyces sp. ISL-96]
MRSDKSGDWDDDTAWLGIDLGTQSVRAVVATTRGHVLGSGSAPLTGRRTGVRHEQDPADWWSAVRAATRGALTGVQARRLRALAVCSTSGTVLLTHAYGDPLTPGLMYDDGRAAPEADEAGVPPSWGLPKALWLARRRNGTTVRLSHQADTVTARLTGGPVATDSSHALKTGYDLERDTWPEEALAQLGLPVALFPEVVRPGTCLGKVTEAASAETGIPAGTLVIAGMTDGCAAQIASGALRPGSWNSVLGTTLVLKGVSTVPVRDSTGIVYNHRSPDGNWLPGGASSVGAGALTAAFPGADPARLDRLAAHHEPSVALAYPLTSRGERFPFRAPDATAFLLNGGTSEGDRWAAMLQGIGYAERLCLDYLHYLGAPVEGPLTFTGGAARSAYWNRLRADILGRPARIPEQTEPALGMAILAAHGAGEGAGPSLADTAEAMVRIRETVHPRPDRTAAFAAPYARLITELTHRGWLPPPVATHALTRLPQ